MPSKQPIADMHVFSLDAKPGNLVLLRERDHLLRRFGELGIFDLAAGTKTEFSVRAEADRFFFLLSGRLDLHLIDLRTGSPSHGVHTTASLDPDNPQGVLGPFGVACGLFAQEDCRLVVLSTHSETHKDDRVATADELQKYAAIQ